MATYVGIDLGTTNSAISSFDGKTTHVWKSPQQNDITPSVIFINKRGNRYYGTQAYNNAPNHPGSVAQLFKRLMGTSSKIKLPAVGIEMTPTECSAEILKVMYGYLPEEVRNDKDLGIVITVPAAFNQMQKNDTMKAAESVGFAHVSLMQEPVAAVMSVMQHENVDGIFVIYDLGGGTLDVAIAEAVGGRVNLVAHDGISMCGGRDFDRVIMDNIVKPWIREHYSVDDNILQPNSQMMRKAAWAAEQAKIQLSSQETALISSEESLATDLDGEDIYLDIEISRDEYNQLIDSLVMESIEKTRETIEKAGLQPADISKVVFVGGPTNYKPLRDKVAFELGIRASIEVNPMTAVAEGASIFAESIDWSNEDHSRKSNKGKLDMDSLGLQFVYNARPTESRTKIMVRMAHPAEGMEFQIDNLDTGWTSGRYPLKDRQSVVVELPQAGDNKFKLFVINSSGGIDETQTIVITRTSATIVGIPASHSLGVILLDKVGGTETIDYLVKVGDSLPAEGHRIYKAGETIRPGSRKALVFNVVEGEIEHPVRDNRPVGALEISDEDIDDGFIPAGTDLEFEYKVLDSGCLSVTVSVPSCGIKISKNNIYTTAGQAANVDGTLQEVNSDGQDLLNRISEMEETVVSESLQEARAKTERALELNRQANSQEEVNEAVNRIFEAKNLLAKARKENLNAIRAIELDKVVSNFNACRNEAKPAEVNRFEAMLRNANAVIGRPGNDFEKTIDQMQGIYYGILFRQPKVIIDYYNWLSSSGDYSDMQKYNALVSKGNQFRDSGDIDGLRKVIAALWDIRIKRGGTEEIGIVNIIRG